MNLAMPGYASLCKKCVGLFSTSDSLRALTSAEGYCHHSRHLLKKYAQLGCELCTILEKWMGNDDEDKDEAAWTFFACRHDVQFRTMMGDIAAWKRTDTAWSSYPFLHKKLSKLGIISRRGILWFQVVADEDDPAADHVDGRPGITSLGNDVVYQKAQEWIHECEQDHQMCPGSQPPPLPTRVIDVSDTGNGQVRLYASRPGECGRYAALSYCWGGDQEYRTTKATLPEKLAGIQEASLGQTIRDAITTCRRISIPYLWVDALCIVQDDDDDKKREIAHMGDVYQLATVAITAGIASSAKEGFLKQLTVPRGIRFPFLVEKTGKVNGTATLLIHQRTGHCGGRGDPTDQRGWCFQEAVLACRRLLFSTDGLFWDCLEEDHKTITEGPTTIQRPFQMLPPPQTGESSTEPPPPLRKRADRWMSYVREYSKRSVTVPTDRTIAIAGIGQALQARYQDGFLPDIGVFRAGLIFQLSWNMDVFGAQVRLRRDPTAIVRRLPGIPTWSWASVTGPIEGLAMGEMRAEVVEVEDDDLGHGILRLRTKVISAREVEADTHKDWRFQFDLVHGTEFDENHWFALLGIDYVRQNAVGMAITRRAGESKREEWERVGLFYTSSSHGSMNRIWNGKNVVMRTLILR